MDSWNGSIEHIRSKEFILNRVWQKWLIIVLRLGFGSLLIFASIDKIQHPHAFAEIVENYRVLGEGLSRWVAVWIPYLEALTGLLLILFIWKEATAVMNCLLMVIFLILVSQATLRGLDIRCGCFFVEGESTIGLLKILENLIYAVLAFLLMKLTMRGVKANIKDGISE